MATHRRPPAVRTPAELLTFRREEWAAPDDGTSWGLPFRRWQIARHTWVGTHPGSELGNMLDALRAERRARRESRQWVP
jgi:hypothetical protein